VAGSQIVGSARTEGERENNTRAGAWGKKGAVAGKGSSYRLGKSRRHSFKAVDIVDSSRSRAPFAVAIFLIVRNDPHYEVLMSAVKTDQSEGIPGAGIPEQAVKKMLTGYAA